MKKIFLKIVIGVVLACILFVCFLYTNNEIGVTSSKLEADIRSSQKIKDDWTVDGSVSSTMAAYISYPQDLSDHSFSVYVNRPGLSFGYFFRGGGNLSGVQRGIAEYTVEGYNERAFISMNQQQITQLEIDDGNTIQVLDIDSNKPFAIVLPISAGTITFYDVNGNTVEYWNCNGMKREELLGMNPYEEGIEGCTWLYPDLPVGVNMEKVPAADCTIHFHPKAGMEKNVKALHLEERYERHKATAHKYLLLRQQYDDAKVEEMVKMGMFPTKDFAYRVLYGEPLDEEAEEGILRKLRRDIAGRG